MVGTLSAGAFFARKPGPAAAPRRHRDGLTPAPPGLDTPQMWHSSSTTAVVSTLSRRAHAHHSPEHASCPDANRQKRLRVCCCSWRADPNEDPRVAVGPQDLATWSARLAAASPLHEQSANAHRQHDQTASRSRRCCGPLPDSDLSTDSISCSARCPRRAPPTLRGPSTTSRHRRSAAAGLCTTRSPRA